MCWYFSWRDAKATGSSEELELAVVAAVHIGEVLELGGVEMEFVVLVMEVAVIPGDTGDAGEGLSATGITRGALIVSRLFNCDNCC